ncbi:MAG: class I SAM-dependent methyltransferase [Hyphomicrobiales bacterium]
MAPPRRPAKKPYKKTDTAKARGGKNDEQGGKRHFRPLAGGLSAKKRDRETLPDKTPKPERPLPIRRKLISGPSPIARAPVMLDMPSFRDYALIDSGFEQKLERYGPYTIVRPEGQALWQPRLPEKTWNEADAIFSGADDEEASGRWKFQNRLSDAKQEDAWTLGFHDIKFHARFTAFRHMGFFPEQAAHWAWFDGLIRKAERPVNVLNLFGYTGVASLIAAKAGASVTHIDASKKAIGWARENQSLSGLDEAPIRWICEDAVKFVEREARRGKTYDGIIMDPPKYGRGPKGEVWQFFEGLSDLLHNTRAILSDDPLFFILSSYAIRASFMASHEVARDVFSGMGGVIESGELLIKEEDSERRLSTSLFTRWSKGNNNE